MKFGSVADPGSVDFKLPPDHPGTKKVFKDDPDLEICVGCAKWNRTDLKGFYPRGTKDELGYYSTQFNSIELNAAFYRKYPPEQYRTWKEKTPDGFKFFPKVIQDITHFKRLQDCQDLVDAYVASVSALEEKLGMVFLQLHNNFTPKSMDRVEDFLKYWPKHIPLAMEFRHTDWYNDREIASTLYDLLEEHAVTNVITDTAGRRDLLHMRLTNSVAFVRYVGANHESDYTRLDDWVKRLNKWRKAGIEKIYFFVHQNIEKESPLLSARFIERLNRAFKSDLKVPEGLD